MGKPCYKTYMHRVVIVAPKLLDTNFAMFAFFSRADRMAVTYRWKFRTAMQTTPPYKTLHLVIHGRVQGVYFRQSMHNEARNLEISGWVRNRSNGTVEAVVQGTPAAVDAMVRWAQRGPELAHVERVDIDPTDGNYSNFEIIN